MIAPLIYRCSHIGERKVKKSVIHIGSGDRYFNISILIIKFKYSSFICDSRAVDGIIDNVSLLLVARLFSLSHPRM